ncbi:MAG: sarcosine oxidase subunit gamma SoxG [Thermodesulfobacteriota bacterium]
MTAIPRQAPVKFAAVAAETENRDGWPVVLKYQEEGPGPWLVDLSHKTRWDLQDGHITRFRPRDIDIPPNPGGCAFKNGVLVNRLNRTQAAVWHLGPETPASPQDPAFTDVTEATAFLALFGPRVFYLTEKLTSLDFLAPDKRPPFLYQGPFSHVPGQVVTLEKDGGAGGGLLWTCSRGYGQAMVRAVLDAGKEFGLRPAGEKTFWEWLARLQSRP